MTIADVFKVNKGLKSLDLGFTYRGDAALKVMADVLTIILAGASAKTFQ